MIAPYFPPRRRIGSLRPFRFAVNLPHFGWKAIVATLDTPGELLTEIEKKELREIDILRLKVCFDQTNKPHRNLSSCSVVDTSRSKSRSFDPWRFLSNGFDQNFPIDTWFPMLMGQYRRVAACIREHRPRAIWSTADPWSSHLLAMRLAIEFGLPWIADFRDPWTLCQVRPIGRSRFARKCDGWAERKILQRANCVVFTAKKTQRVYESHYDFSIPATTIYNAFDRVDGRRNAMPIRKRQSVDLVFFGKFRPLSPATRIIEILLKLKEFDPTVFSFVRVHSFAPLKERDIMFAKKKGVLDRFVAHEPVSPEHGIEVLRNFDILLLSADPRRKEIVPAKLWDYLAAGRPILSICTNPEIQSVLSEVQSGIQLNNDAKIVDLLVRCWEAKRDGMRLPIPFCERSRAVENYDAYHATSALAERLEAL